MAAFEHHGFTRTRQISQHRWVVTRMVDPKQAKAIEAARDEANQKASEAMQQAVNTLFTGVVTGAVGLAGTAGLLPTASTSLGGCTVCRFSAITSK